MAIDIDDLPELDTPIGIAGSNLRQEVGGSVCFSIAVAVAVFVSEDGG